MLIAMPSASPVNWSLHGCAGVSLVAAVSSFDGKFSSSTSHLRVPGITYIDMCVGSACVCEDLS